MSEDPGCGVPSKPTKRELRELRLMVDWTRYGYRTALSEATARLSALTDPGHNMSDDWIKGVEAAMREVRKLAVGDKTKEEAEE